MKIARSPFTGKSEHLRGILQVAESQQAEGWNTWRSGNPDRVDLRGANLRGASLPGVNLSRADLNGADLTGAKLPGANLVSANLTGAIVDGAEFIGANLEEAQFSGATLVEAVLRHADITASSFRGADLTRANLEKTYGEDAIFAAATMLCARMDEANLWGATLRGAILRGVRLRDANLNQADLREADLTGADLIRARLTGVKLEGTRLRGAQVYGVSVWDARLDETTDQRELSIAPPSLMPRGERDIRVDDIELAQFVNLLLDHRKLRNAINATTQRGVLILGRFRQGGLGVLRLVAEVLREHRYLPIIFEFERPEDRDYTETVMTLAGLSRFVIVDLSGPSVPQELHATVPHFSIPFVPIVESGQRSPSMLKNFGKYPWFLGPAVEFQDEGELKALVRSTVITRAEEELAKRHKESTSIR